MINYSPSPFWYLSAAPLLIGIALFLHLKYKHGFIPVSPDEDNITPPVSPIAKEYAWLYDRIINAPTKTELAVLELQAIEFKTYFTNKTDRECVDDLFRNLSEELNIRNHQLSCKTIQA